MKCGMADGKLYDAVIVGLDPVGDVGADQALRPRRFSRRRTGRQRRGASRRLVLRDGQSVPAGHRFSSHGQLRRRLRRASLPVSRRHAVGIHRLPAGRRRDQSRQLRRSAVRCARPADRHQRPRLVRKARPRECRRRLCDFDQSDQELPRRFEIRPDSRSCHARRRDRHLGRRPRAGQRYSRAQRRLPPRPALRRRNHLLRRPADPHRQRLQEHPWAFSPRVGACRSPIAATARPTTPSSA